VRRKRDVLRWGLKDLLNPDPLVKLIAVIYEKCSTTLV
jgi:hypothetical protein